MGNNSDDDLDDGTWLHRNLDELRLAGVRQITQPIYLANTPAVGAPTYNREPEDWNPNLFSYYLGGIAVLSSRYRQFGNTSIARSR